MYKMHYKNNFTGIDHRTQVFVPLVSHKLDYMLHYSTTVSEQLKHASYTSVFLQLESISHIWAKLS